jgi:hypothetical protein
MECPSIIVGSRNNVMGPGRHGYETHSTASVNVIRKEPSKEYTSDITCEYVLTYKMR